MIGNLLRTTAVIIAVFFACQANGQYQEVEVKNGGAISGQVKLLGKVPKLEPLKVTKDEEVCGRTKPSELLLLSAEKGIANVVVSIENILKGKRASRKELATLNNKDCLFSPHLQAVVAGTTLEIQNSDPVLHNTHSNYVVVREFLSSISRLMERPHPRLRRRRTAFNIALPRQGMKVRKVLRWPGIIAVACDEHGWMLSYIIVMPHPYFAVTDKDGKFTIRNIPPGKYKLRAWHETLGTQEKEIMVKEKGEAKVEFHYSFSP